MKGYCHFLRNILFHLFCICPCLLQADYWTPWVEDPFNPVHYSPYPDSLHRAYYPTVHYDKDQFSGNGASTYYKMWSDNTLSPPNIWLSTSNDGVTWSTGTSTSGLVSTGRHSVVLYDADGFGEVGGYYYKIWYWDTSVSSSSISAFRHAKSVDGLNWVSDGVCSQDPTYPLVNGTSPGYFVNFFGPSTVLYNKNATNIPGSPMTFRYVLYYIGSAAGSIPNQWDNSCLAYSPDGIAWTRYASPYPVLLPTGILGDWDANYSTSPSVIKTEDMYHMWYSGSEPNGSGDIKGIGYASSVDGLQWVRASTNPIFDVNTTLPTSWRHLRTYACSVLFDADYFGVPADNKSLKMWFTGVSSPTPTSIYSVGYATSNFLTNPAVSTVMVAPSNVIADGISISTITVTLKATEGEPVVGSTVTLTPNQGSSVVTDISGVSDANGQVFFTVSDTLVETIIYTATDTTNDVVILQKGVVSFVAPMPPSSIVGKQKKNDFGVVYELYNLLKWTASSTPGIQSYYIYRNGVKIATVCASRLEYEDHNRPKGVTTLYSITSVVAGNESAPINVAIK